MYNYVIRGWPHVVDPSLVPFKTRKDELSTRRGCLIWGARVIVPPSLQQRVLQDLLDTHPGISRMKALALSYVWWPNMDSDIELTVSSCSTYQSMRSDPPEFKFIPGPFQHHRGLAFTWILQGQSLAVPTLWL